MGVGFGGHNATLERAAPNDRFGGDIGRLSKFH
jgi:hypothetical protein